MLPEFLVFSSAVVTVLFLFFDGKYFVGTLFIVLSSFVGSSLLIARGNKSACLQITVFALPVIALLFMNLLVSIFCGCFNSDALNDDFAVAGLPNLSLPEQV